MAKKPSTVEQPHSAESIIAVIKALPPEERNRVFDFANRHKENKAVSQLLELAFGTLREYDKLRQLLQKKVGVDNPFLSTDFKEAETLDEHERIRQADKDFAQLRNEVERWQRTRGSIPENQETLELYHKLVIEYGGTQRGAKKKALEKLVTLPSEQEKDYVTAYKESCTNHPTGEGDLEPVRLHIKDLERTEKKHRPND